MVSANTTQRLQKDIADCQTVLAIPDVCKELAGPAKAALAIKTVELSFITRPLPKVPRLTGPTDPAELKELLDNAFADRKNIARNLADGVAMHIDYLADPASGVKKRKLIWRYDSILQSYHETRTDIFGPAFWDRLVENLDELNNDKYKHGLEFEPGSAVAQITTAAKTELDNYFKEKQTRLEQSLGVSKGKMPYGLESREHLEFFYDYSKVMKSAMGKALLRSESVNDVATFLVAYGQELYTTSFMPDLSNNLGGYKFKANVKSNIQRIAQKITETMLEEDQKVGKAWSSLTDLIRFTVFCKTPAEVKHFFQTVIMKQAKLYGVLRFKPRFNSHLSDMIINFNSCNWCVGELQIKLGDGSLPRGFDSQHFVYECLRSAKSRRMGLLDATLTLWKNKLTDAGKIDFADPDAANPGYCVPNPDTFQELEVDNGKDNTNYTD